MTYYIVLPDVKREERGGQTTATVIGLRPSEASLSVDYGSSIWITFRSSLQECYGR